MLRQPMALLSIGPIVPPERTSFRIWKVCNLQLPFAAMRCMKEVDTASVVMWPLESADTATPLFNCGAGWPRQRECLQRLRRGDSP